MTVSAAFERYWKEVGQYHKAAPATLWSLRWLEAELEPKTHIASICDSDVARLVARRRDDKVLNVARDLKPTAAARRPKSAGRTKRVSPARVNRSVTEPLRKVLRRARVVWGQEVQEIAWKEHLLPEPKERVREARLDEEARLFAALDAQWHAIVRFYLRMGIRETAVCTLEWAQIDWGARTVAIVGKGDVPIVLPLPDDMRDMLWRLWATRPNETSTRVFRYRRSDDPMTVSGFVSAFRRARTRAQIKDLRVHDLRHTAATRTLRATGNLKLVQTLLGHRDIATTARYAHVFDEDLRAALNAMPATPGAEAGADQKAAMPVVIERRPKPRARTRP